MAKRNYKTYTLFDNYNGWDFDEAKKELIECNDYNENEVTDDMVWNAISEWEQDDFDIMLSEMKTFESKNNFPKWLCMGSVGTWMGTRDGGKIFNSFEEMLRTCATDCDYIAVTYNTKGEMFIRCSHHDGTNYFTCKFVTDKGYTLYDNWDFSYRTRFAGLKEYEILEKLWNSSKYTKNPCFHRFY